MAAVLGLRRHPEKIGLALRLSYAGPWAFSSSIIA